MEEVKEWVALNAPECRVEQKHLDAGTAERAYWHHGYLSALQDVPPTPRLAGEVRYGRSLSWYSSGTSSSGTSRVLTEP